jgi:hypothetical protein
MLLVLVHYIVIDANGSSLTMLLVYCVVVVGPTYHVPKYPPKPFPLCYYRSFVLLVAIPIVLHMFW